MLRVKSSKDRYYLELKIENTYARKMKKENTTNMEIVKMFIHIEYSLQVEVHHKKIIKS